MNLAREMGNIISRLRWELQPGNRPLVHVVGDSHVKSFAWLPGCVAHHLGAATAYRLADRGSTTGAREKLFELTGRLDPARHVFLLVFGEVDCRIHIYEQHVKTNGTVPVDVLLDRTVERYGSVMKELAAQGTRFAVLGPPPATRQDNIYGRPVYAAPGMHKVIYAGFNEKLREFCRREGYPYVDIQLPTSGPDGLVLARYAADEVHLNRAAARIALKLAAWR